VSASGTGGELIQVQFIQEIFPFFILKSVSFFDTSGLPAQRAKQHQAHNGITNPTIVSAS